MVVYYPSSDNPLFIYFDSDDVKRIADKISYFRHHRQAMGYRKMTSSGDEYFILCSRKLTPNDELNYLIKLWNDEKIRSAEIMGRIGELVAQQNADLILNLKK